MRHKSWFHAVLVIVLGLLLMAVAFALGGFRVSGLSSKGLTEKMETFPGAVKEIVIEEEVGTVRVISSDKDEISLSRYEGENDQYEVKHTSGESLDIRKIKRTGWFNWDIFRFIDKPTMTLEIPKGEAVMINIKTDNGVIELTDLIGTDVILKTDLGKITVSDMKIDGDLSAQTDKGVIQVTGVNAEGTLTLSTDLGAIEAENVYASSIKAESDNGVVRLTNADISGAIDIGTSLGGLEGKNIRFGNTFKGRCDNGGIRLEFEGKQSDYTILADTDLGNSNVDDQVGETDKTIDVKTSLGGITLSFTGK